MAGEEEEAGGLDANDLIHWGDTLSEEREQVLQAHAEALREGSSTSTEPASVFPCSARINSAVSLHRGKAHALRADALAHPASERLDFAEPESSELLRAAGEQLLSDCLHLPSLRPSEATASYAHGLPALRIIHAVGPTYHGDDTDLARAAESSLSGAYRSTLEILLHEHLRSLALPCLYTRSKGYPRETASHVALRTVRRFLEDWIDRIDVIVFCVEGDDRELYSRNMPLYFPRSEAEERVSREALPRYPGDDLGQAYDALNDISIKPSPLPFANGHTYSSMKHAPGGHLEPSWWGSSERVGMHIGPRDPESEAEHHHVRLLKHARQYDLSDISQLNVMYRAGDDAAGRPVIAIAGNQLEKALEQNLEKRLLLYAAREFGPLCRQRFTGLFIASGCRSVPGKRFARRLCAALGPRHKENLKVLYLLHPPVQMRTAIAISSVISCGIPKGVFSKIALIDSLSMLERCGCNDMELPKQAYEVNEKSRNSRSYQ